MAWRATAHKAVHHKTGHCFDARARGADEPAVHAAAAARSKAAFPAAETTTENTNAVNAVTATSSSTISTMAGDPGNQYAGCRSGHQGQEPIKISSEAEEDGASTGVQDQKVHTDLCLEELN